jgi:hypothetical protein
MERYNTATQKKEQHPKIDTFINAVCKLCEEKGFSIAHEDTQGAFIIEPWNQYDENWLQDAFVEIVPEKKPSINLKEL